MTDEPADTTTASRAGSVAGLAARADAPFSLAGVRRGVRDIAPLMLAMVPYGMAFGVAAAQKGLEPWQALALSGLVFAGSAQFAALDLWVAPLAVLPVLLTTLAINARHLLYGAALYPWLRGSSAGQRFPVVAVLTDSTWVYATQAEARGERDAGTLLGAGLLTWAVWVGSTALGLFAGGTIPDPKTFGIDVVMAVFFAVSLTGLWRGTDTLKPWAAAAAAGLLGMWLLPVGWHVIAGGLAGGLVGMLTDKPAPAVTAGSAADGH
jgi:4-azaleucine resistance transporter AzlC